MTSLRGGVILAVMSEANAKTHWERPTVGLGLTVVSTIGPTLGIALPQWLRWIGFGVGVILIAWPLLVAAYRRIRRIKVSPVIIQLIGVGLIVLGAIVVGLGALAQQNQKTDASTNRTSATATAEPPQKVKIKTNPYDVPRKLKAIDDDILPILKLEMDPLVKRGLQLQSNWGNFLKDRPKYIKDLQDYRVQWQSLAQKIADIRVSNQQYYDIQSLLNQDYQEPFSDSLGRFTGAVGSIGVPPYNMDLNFFIKPYSDALSAAINGMDIWRHKTYDKFVQLRKDVAAEQ
jgi:hypothetical protein